jgi:hypothetical protein
VVVRSADESVEGVLSRRDIVYSPLAWTLGAGKNAHEKALAAHPVKSMMTSDVVTVDSHQLLSEAASLMQERRIGCLPVVDGDRLVGILTESDFVTLVAGHASVSLNDWLGGRPKMGCAGPGGEPRGWHGARLRRSRSSGARSPTQPARMDRRSDGVPHLGLAS